MIHKMIQFLKIMIINCFIFLAIIIFPLNLHASDLNIDNELYRDGIVINLADICLKDANVPDDSTSEEEGRQLLDVIKNKYGDKYYSTLSKSSEDAKEIYSGLLDQYIGCELALIKTREIYNSYGLKGDNYTNALNKFKDISNTSDNKNENKYQDYISTYTRSERLVKEHNKLLPFLVNNTHYGFANELLQSSLNMIGKKFSNERVYDQDIKKKNKENYENVIKEQDNWKLFKRDKMAIQLADTMPLERAYTQVMLDRNNELSSLVATEPHEGYYHGGNVIFIIYKHNGEYYINGYRPKTLPYGAITYEEYNCKFKGKLEKFNRWYRVEEGDIPQFYLLFTDDSDKSGIINHSWGNGQSICGYDGIKGSFSHISKEALQLSNINHYKQIEKIINSNDNPPNANPPVSSPQKGNLKLTDNLHNQFLSEDSDYALTDAMLNATWKMVKKNLDKSAFASVQKEQRAWASSKRDERATSYAASMPPSQAYTKVMQERIAVLSSLIAKEPRIGDYENERSLFNISKDNGEYKIDGSADNAAGNTCMFEGQLTKDSGWYKVHEGGLPPYYVLFTDKGAFIEHAGSGAAFDCGANVDFKGEYKFAK